MNFTSFLSPVFSGWNNTGMNAQNVTFVSHLEQIHILNRAALDIWYELIWWFVYGFTANKMAKETEVLQKLVHKCFIIIRKALYEYEEENIKPVFGTVEIDETYVGPKFKNRKKNNRKYYRKVNAVKSGRGAKTVYKLYLGFIREMGQCMWNL